MRTEPTPKKRVLQGNFAAVTPIKPQTHTLQPGHSMLVGYPGSDFEGDVHLLAYGAKDSIFTSICTNGPQAKVESSGELLTLSLAIKLVLQKTMPFSFEDLPVTVGGETHEKSIFIVTPREWRQDNEEMCDHGMLAGPFRIHGGVGALKAIADGDRPEKMALVGGLTQMTYSLFTTHIRNNVFGEIAANDDLIFQTGTPEDKWNKAMALHTGGRPLSLPIPYQSHGKGPDGVLHPKWPN